MLLSRSRNLFLFLASAAGAAGLAAGAGVAAAQEPTPNPPAPQLPPSPDSSPPQDAPVVAVTGRGIDVLGKPVAGAIVRVEATGESATTDRDGKFRISAAIGASLVVEHSGFDPALANVTAGRLDDVVMLKAGSN